MEPTDTAEHPVILFDGECNLCNGFIQFIISNDPDAKFRFAPLQSDIASDLLEEDRSLRPPLTSMILVDDGECYEKSAASLRLADYMGWPYQILSVLRLLPRGFRDIVYDEIASRRYQWFGKKDECMRPTPDVTDRFITSE